MDPLLDLELLRTFAEVVKAGELKKAAAAVFRSQAAVSMQIKRLEEQVGTRLLERNNQGIQLTDAGNTLLDYCQQFLRLNSLTLAALSQDQLSGRINFGIPTDYAQDFLHSFMPLLKQELPKLDARITCDRSRTLRDQVERGELDVAIVSGEPGYENEAMLWSERLVWSAPAGFQYEPQEPLPIALFEDNCIVRDLCLADLKRAKIAYQPVFTSPVMENIAAAVQAGLAVSLLPESTLRVIRSRPLPPGLLPGDHLLRINLIWSPLIDKVTLERLTACMRLTASQYNRQS
uniref:LysR family transcriptional regulator n=1 Tax=Marinobacterium profundum TaxID=1714300 RepID=UPI0008363A05|nr:LysR family transcriptional regulator [Marinobacterium profundum]